MCTYVNLILSVKIYSFFFFLVFVVGVGVAMILDYKNPALAQYSGGVRFVVFMLETVSTRFAGK